MLIRSFQTLLLSSLAAVALVAWGLSPAVGIAAQVDAVPNVFTYQGRLEMDGEPVNGTVDMIVDLYDGALFVGSDSVPGVSVDNGLFTIELSFAAPLFTGASFELEFLVRSPAGSGSYTTLAPRQPLTTSPYAFHANTANTLLTPTSIDGASPSEVMLSVNNALNGLNNAALRATQGTVDNAVSSIISRVVEVESADTAIGVAGFGDRFGMAGFVDDNSTNGAPAGVLGEVLGSGADPRVGVRALNSPAGTRADLATESLAGEFIGDVQVSGAITRSYLPGTFDFATPIAYGYINTNGTVASGTPNFSVTYNSSSDWYEIEIDDEYYYFSDFVTVVTPASTNQRVRVSSAVGRMLVIISDTATGTNEQGYFQFATFKPGGPVLEGNRKRNLVPLSPGTPLDTDAKLKPQKPREPIQSQPEKGIGGMRRD